MVEEKKGKFPFRFSDNETGIKFELEIDDIDKCFKLLVHGKSFDNLPLRLYPFQI